MQMQPRTETLKIWQHMESMTRTTLGGACKDSPSCLATGVMSIRTRSWHCGQRRAELGGWHLQPLETERLPEAHPRKPQGLQISYLHANSDMPSALDPARYFLKLQSKPL